MGIYADIQKDLKEAMDDDLADAVATLVVTDQVFDSHDSVAGAPVYIETEYTMRCIVTDDEEEGKVDSDTTTHFVSFMVLDSEKTIEAFAPNMKANVRGTDFEIGHVEIDPAGATHTLKCRRL